MIRRAFSLLEVVVAGSVMTGVMLFVAGATSTSISAANYDMSASRITGDLRRSLDLMASELRDAGGDEFNNDYVAPQTYTAGGNAATISFRRRTALNTVDSTTTLNNWGTPISYQLTNGAGGEVAGNGTDDDGDGLVDEFRLTRTQNGVTTDVCDNVVTFTVSRDATSDDLQLRLVIARPYVANGLRSFLAQVGTTRVTLRNRPRTE